MNKKIEKLLEAEIGRFNSIIAYQDKLTLNESPYRFYNEADDIPIADEDPNTELGNDDIMQPDAGELPPPPDGEAMPQVGNDPNTVEEMPPLDNTEPLGGEDMGMPEEDVTEIDITDLVNDTKDIMNKTTDALSKIEAVISKVDSIESNLKNMDTLIGKIEDMTRQVELMRPPTESERRKALAKDSYPFNIPIEQYKEGEGYKNQTDMEKDSKMSMLNTIMGDYNDSTVKDSFSSPQDNFFTNRK